MDIKVLKDNSEFEAELKNAGSKLVVVDFYADWCGPCKVIAPKYKEFASKYPDAIFLKVNVDENEETAESQGISAMPTFIFYKNGAKIDEMKGANAEKLEEKIKEHQ